jgi:hypothetical protein
MKYRPISLLSVLMLALAALAAEDPKQDKTSAAANSPIDGTWKWIFTMPDGTKVQPKLKLKLEDGQLTGTSTFRPDNETPISEARFRNGDISFQVVRSRDGQTVTTKYRGHVQGDTIKGTIESDWMGETQTYPWEAKRPPPTATGTWAWKVRYGASEFVIKLRLTQDGEKLTGKIAVVGRREHDVTEGTVKHGEVSFLDERERDGRKYSTRYHGKLDGDILKGKVEIDWDGEKRLRNWVALRISDSDQ